MSIEPFERLALALAIGFLVGVERGWRAREVAEGGRTAGIRTYALSGLLGGVAGELALALGAWAFVGLAAPFAAAFILFKQRELQEEGDFSVTDVIAALLVFALGAYAVVGDWRAASAVAVAATGLLALKEVLHTWLKRLVWPELRSALVLLAMSVVVLPLLPNRTMGPYGAFNPYELWLLTILIAGVSFLAYTAVKVLGPTRGTMLAALAGALVSSTAVTLSLARQSRERPEAVLAQAGAALLAGAVMASRILVIAGLLAPALLAWLGLPLVVFALVSGGLGALAGWRGRTTAAAGAAPLKSPFDLAQVLKFALLLGLVMAAARVVSGIYGPQGLLPVAAIGGLADVDAVTLTIGDLAARGADTRLAAYAILLAAGVDSLTKMVIGVFVGGRRFGALFAAGTLLGAVGAAAGLAVAGETAWLG